MIQVNLGRPETLALDAFLGKANKAASSPSFFFQDRQILDKRRTRVVKVWGSTKNWQRSGHARLLRHKVTRSSEER
jgi:hypothetical protein